MPIIADDILFKLSVKTGAAGNTDAGTPVGSLGKYISTTEIVDATLHNLFDVITGDENADEDVEYRCLFIHNAHATITWEGVVVWMSAEVADGANAAIGVDPTAVSAIGSAGAQAVEVVDESTAPAGVTFSAPTTKGTGLALGDLAAGECRAVWVRRTATNSAALNNDGVTVTAAGDTVA